MVTLPVEPDQFNARADCRKKARRAPQDRKKKPAYIAVEAGPVSTQEGIFPGLDFKRTNHKDMSFLNALQQDLENLDHSQAAELERAEQENNERAQLEGLGKRFEQRFKTGSWLQLNWPKRKAAERSTYFFHLISGSGAMYAFYMLFGVIVWSWLGLVGAIVVIFFHEREKRRWSDRFWDSFVANKNRINWKALAINASLFLASLLLTVGGAYFGLKDNMPGAKQVGASNDPVAIALQQQLAEAKGELTSFEGNKSNYTSKGEIYYKRLDTWSSLQDKVNSIDKQLLDQFGIISIENKGVLNEWYQKRWFVVLMGILICLLSEIGFEYNMYFRSRYDYKYYQAKMAQAQRKSAPLPYQANGIPVNGNNGQKKSPVLS